MVKQLALSIFITRQACSGLHQSFLLYIVLGAGLEGVGGGGENMWLWDATQAVMCMSPLSESTNPEYLTTCMIWCVHLFWCEGSLVDPHLACHATQAVVNVTGNHSVSSSLCGHDCQHTRTCAQVQHMC